MQVFTGQRMIHVECDTFVVEIYDGGNGTFAVFKLQCQLLINFRFEIVAEVSAIGADDAIF